MYKVDIKCPNCNKKMRAKVFNQLSVEKIPAILDGTLFKIKCNECNNEIRIDYPVQIELDDYLITYNNKDVESNKKIRITETFDDFKEKILIFSDNYNDILIEYIKDYIIENASLKDKELRYDSSNEENLIFTIIGDYKNVGVSIKFYEELLKKVKLKDNDIINHINYKDYIKL